MPLLPRQRVTAVRRPERGKRLLTCASADSGIHFLLDDIFPVDAALEFPWGLAGVRFGPVFHQAIGALHHAVVLGLPGAFHTSWIANPESHNPNCVGRSPREPRGAPLSMRNRSGRPRSFKTRRKRCWTSHRNLIEVALGKKRTSLSSCRCTRLQTLTTTPSVPKLTSSVRQRPLARLHAGTTREHIQTSQTSCRCVASSKAESQSC